MDDSPPQTRSFVVKIWTEDSGDGPTDVSWRGSITNVETEERHYFQSLPEVISYLAPFVLEIGGTFSLRTRLCLWLSSPRTAQSDPSTPES